MHILTYGLSQDKLAGIETFLLNMNKFMSDDVIFDYVVEGTYSIHEPAIREKGGSLYFIAPKRSMFRNLRDWVRLLKSKKKTVKVVYFNLYSLAWFLPVILSLLFGYKAVVHAHNNNLHNCGAAQKTMHAVNRELQKLFRIVRLTNSKESSVFFFGNKPAEMVYCAIDPLRFAYDESKRQSLRMELGIPDANVYGFVGRVAYQKNPLFLMSIYKEIAERDANAVFLVVGDGDLMEETRSLAEKFGLNILFTGAKENVQDYYQAMDVFVLPSRFEGLGIVLIEAQASGLPCVASADVIPQDAKVLNTFRFVGLGQQAAQWAEHCVQARSSEEDRHGRNREVLLTRFNIVTEAKHLEKILSEQ